MPLIKKNTEGAKGAAVHVPGWLYDRVAKFAEAGGYTVKSVFATALEEWLDERDDDDGIEAKEPTKGPPVRLTGSQRALRAGGDE